VLPDQNNRVRRLNTDELRERGLECDELWDVDRMLTTDDWAVHDFIREGIEAIHIQQRVAEERHQLLIHAERMARWVLRQSRVLIDLLCNQHHRHAEKLRDQLKLHLLHRDKVADSLLRMKNADILPAERKKELLDLRLRISNVMHRMLEEPDVVDEDDDDAQYDENWQAAEIQEEVAAIVAERLEEDDNEASVLNDGGDLYGDELQLDHGDALEIDLE
jgi:hypothetical protein